MLAYPYLRRWDVATLCAMDAVLMMAAGRRAVLRTLLSVRHTLGRDDQRYLLNTIFLDDYCTWALRVPERQLQAAAELLLAAVSALRPDDAAFAAWRLPALLAAAAAGGGDGVEEEEEEEEEDEDDDDDGDDDEDDTDESSDDSSSSSSSEVAGGSAPAGWRPLIEVVEDTAATS